MTHRDSNMLILNNYFYMNLQVSLYSKCTRRDKDRELVKIAMEFPDTHCFHVEGRYVQLLSFGRRTDVDCRNGQGFYSVPPTAKISEDLYVGSPLTFILYPYLTRSSIVVKISIMTTLCKFFFLFRSIARVTRLIIYRLQTGLACFTCSISLHQFFLSQITNSDTSHYLS